MAQRGLVLKHQKSNNREKHRQAKKPENRDWGVRHGRLARGIVFRIKQNIRNQKSKYM